jgi:hypothetical protein
MPTPVANTNLSIVQTIMLVLRTLANLLLDVSSNLFVVVMETPAQSILVIPQQDAYILLSVVKTTINVRKILAIQLLDVFIQQLTVLMTMLVLKNGVLP